MNQNLVWSKFVFSLFLCLALLVACTSPVWAQSSTGSLTGTVTDPSGGVVSGATVTATNVGTGQTRTTTTDSSGSYKFALLPPGYYSVSFSASGFKTSEVPSILVNVTETPVLDQRLVVGGQATQVTVESTAETIQTQNVTNGEVVGSQEVVDLPLVSRNYTQIINLSPGVVSNVTTASSVGNGTVDVAANGARENQNNYSMDGGSIVNYVSGTAGQTGSYPGIAIPNPDSIQEFKVQTSQYDASSGRNPGANVTVVTKGGTNQFHGDIWEFNRNNFFNANDFFYKRTEEALDEANTPQTLKQNTFGGTIGGPIKKDKIFFFGSYQGIRQVNGIGTSGFASGYESNVQLLPWSDPADPSDPRHLTGPATGPGSYRAYLGSVFGGTAFGTCDPFFIVPATLPLCNTGVGTGETVAPDGSNITNTAIALLQAPGLIKNGFNKGFYFPSAPATCKGVPTTDTGCNIGISIPIVANENQYMANTDYVLSSKNTLSEKFFTSSDPQVQPFNCFISAGNCNPGAPADAHYTNYVAQLKLTSVLTSNLVNEARVAYHRDVEDNTDPNPLEACNFSTVGSIIPLVNNGASCGTVTPALAKQYPELNIVPMFDILGIGSPTGPWSQGGNFSMISTNYINTYQFGDQLSWNHGKHALRFGFDGERILYNNTIPSSGRGELLMYSTADFLTSSSGIFKQDPAYSDGTPQTANGGILLGFGLKGTLTHYNRINAFDWYAQDDIKVSRKLTVNLGLRWEYDGFPDDKSGQFANEWNSQLQKTNSYSAFQALGPTGTLTGFVVPSNFDVKDFGLTAPGGATGVLVNSNKTLVPGTPLDNFAPRIGVAWQPLSEKFVVRAGYGMFYDRIYGNLLIDNQLNLPPYSGSGSGPCPACFADTVHDPFAAGAGPLVWTPRYEYNTAGAGCTETVVGSGSCVISSGLGYTADSQQMANRLPLTQEYSLDLQYELAHGWIVDVGYVGSHGIHLYNYSQDINLAHLVAGAPNGPTDAQNESMVGGSIPWNVGNPDPILYNTTANANTRVPVIGYSADGGLATTDTNGDSLYNSLQAQLKHQFSHGLLLQVAYTWSKGLTNINTAEAGSGINPPGEVLYGASNSNNPLNLGQQYGLSSFNRPQRVVISYVYDLPFRHRDGVSERLLSGWSVSGVTTIQDGLPFSVVNSLGGSIFYSAGSANTRAQLADPVNCNTQGVCQSGIPTASSGSTTSRAMNGWVNDAAFGTGSGITFSPTPLPCIGGIPNPGGSATDPCGEAVGGLGPGDPGAKFTGAGTGWGDDAVGLISGPGQFNFDLAVIKDTKLWEGGTLQFRVESFNIWNHPQFDPPFGVDANTPSTFGEITSTSTTPRVMQFGLKLLF
ncbi:MAG TPA: TonB-dependent receptor [Candidatus Cybelea sp.]|nr:TonB-dependent receptor [Candidatus Cybelea sp.]